MSILFIVNLKIKKLYAKENESIQQNHFLSVITSINCRKE